LITQFVNRTFIADYHPTCEERYRTSIDANNKVCIINIVDTGAQEMFSGIVFVPGSAIVDMKDVTTKNLAEKDGYLFVFSLSDTESLTRLNDVVLSLQV